MCHLSWGTFLNKLCGRFHHDPVSLKHMIAINVKDMHNIFQFNSKIFRLQTRPNFRILSGFCYFHLASVLSLVEIK